MHLFNAFSKLIKFQRSNSFQIIDGLLLSFYLENLEDFLRVQHKSDLANKDSGDANASDILRNMRLSYNAV